MSLGAKISSLWRRLTAWVPLKPLDRYLIKHFMICYVICSAILLGLFVVLEGLSHIDNFMKQEESLLFVIFQYFLWTAPQYYCQMLGPILTLMAALFAVTLLNKGNEIVPMRAAGISVQRILAPLFAMAALAGVGMYCVQELVLPNFRTEIRKAHSFGERSDNIRDVFIEDLSHQTIEVPIYVPHERAGKHSVENLVRVIRMWPNNKMHQLIHSREIAWIQTGSDSEDNGYWQLRGDVQIQTWNQSGVEQSPDKQEKLDLITEVKPTDLEMTSKEERAYLSRAELSRQYQRNTGQHHLKVKIHRRLAFPLANVILLLLGFPFIFRGFNQSIFVGIGTAIAIAALYLLADTVCADLGNDGILPAVLAAWLPALFFGALGYTLFDGIEG